MKRHGNSIDETDNIYGRLRVVRQTPSRDKCGRIKWLCQCMCGNNVVVLGTSLRNGSTKEL